MGGARLIGVAIARQPSVDTAKLFPTRHFGFSRYGCYWLSAFSHSSNLEFTDILTLARGSHLESGTGAATLEHGVFGC
jgi:hypothetical protein